MDENKYFLISRGELEERLDVNYYQPFILNFIKLLEERSDTKQLKNFIKKIETGYNNTYSTDGTIRFLRTQNIRPIFLNASDTPLTKDKIIRRTKKGDLLFTRIGVNVGDVSFNDEGEYAISDNVIRAEINNPILAKYISIFLSTEKGKMLLAREKRDTARPIISYGNIRRLLIPILSDDLQNLCIEKINEAYNQRGQKQRQAKDLLNSIDDYLLQELGIQLPTPPANTIQNRTFTSSWQKMISNRFDPLYHQGSIYGGIEKTKYKFEMLKQHTNYFKTGFAAGRNDQDDNKKGFIQIRPTNISEKRNFVFNKSIHIDPTTLPNFRQELLQVGEVLFNNTNSQELVGKTVYFNLADEYFCSNHITRIKTAATLHPVFLTYIFNLYQRKKVFYKYCINWNNQSGVNTEFLKRLFIPVPDVTDQEKIIEKLDTIKQEANKLLNEAQQQFNKTKKEIEQLILE